MGSASVRSLHVGVPKASARLAAAGRTDRQPAVLGVDMDAEGAKSESPVRSRLPPMTASFHFFGARMAAEASHRGARRHLDSRHGSGAEWSALAPEESPDH